MAENTTEFGILIKAVDQATSTLKSVQAELERLQRSTGAAARGADAMANSHAKLGGVLQSVNQQLTRVNPAMGQLASQMAEIADASSGAGGILAGTAAALAAVGVASVIAAHAIGDYQEKMDIASETTGLSQRQIGGLTVMLSNIGRSFDSVQPSLTIFARKLDEARSGSGEAAKAFERLKTPQGQLIDTSNTTSEVFDQVVSSLKNIPDASERARFAFQLFGRGSISMLAILNQDLSESEKIAEKLGIVLSPAMQQVARDADAAGDRLKLSFTGMMNSITVALAPLGTTLIKMVDQVITAIHSFVDAFKGLKTFADSVKMDSAAAQLDIIGQSADRNQKHVKNLKDELIRLQMQAREGGFQAPDLGNIPGFTQGAKSPALRPGALSKEAPSLDAGPLAQYIVGLLQVKDATNEAAKAARALSDEQQAQLTATKKQIEQLSDLVRLGVVDRVQQFDTLSSMRAQSLSRENLKLIQTQLNAITTDYLSLQHSDQFLKEQDLKLIRDAGFAINDQIRTLDRRRAVNAITLDEEIAQLTAKKAAVESAQQLLQIEQKISDLLKKRADELGFTSTKAAGRLPSPGDSTPAGPEPPPRTWVNVPPENFMEAFNKQLRTLEERVGELGGVWGEFGEKLASIVFPLRNINASIATMGSVIASTFITGFGAAARSLVTGTVNVGQAFNSLAQTMIQAIAEIAAQAAATGLIKAIAPALATTAGVIGAVGFITAVAIANRKNHAQQGGTLMQEGGTLLAQSGGSLSGILPMFRSQSNDMYSTGNSGLIVSGMRGSDTVPLRAGRGETVLSHHLTDLNERVMTRMDSFLNLVSKKNESDSPVQGPTVHEFHFHGQFMDKNSLRQFAEEELVPQILDIERRGSHRSVR